MSTVQSQPEVGRIPAPPPAPWASQVGPQDSMDVFYFSAMDSRSYCAFLQCQNVKQKDAVRLLQQQNTVELEEKASPLSHKSLVPTLPS